MKHLPNYASSNGNHGKILIIPAAAGLVIVVSLFTSCQGPTTQSPANSSSPPTANQSVAQQPVLVPFAPSPSVSPSPSPTPSPSPSPTVTPRPAVKAEPARVPLSTGPVATNVDAANKRGPVTIRLMDGNAIKADEVWETKEGIWYRRRGLVTLLKRDQVKALENPKPSPSPTPSPTPTPS